MDGEGAQSASAFASQAAPTRMFLRSASGTSGRPNLLGIYETKVPGRGSVPMLRTLMTTVCDRSCGYCPFGKHRDFRRSSWKPEVLSNTVLEMWHAGLIKGFFLSSGLATAPARIMDRMLATAELLRAKGYRDYLHLKLLPGADSGQVAQAMRLANRVSVNLEAPTPSALQVIAPEKRLTSELVSHVRTVADLNRRFPEHRPRGGLVTQFVVGPGGESDRTLLDASTRLYRDYQVRRVYFSAFIPVLGTPMEGVRPTHPAREFRLYQADWLLRFYGFSKEELSYAEDGNLPLHVDPKTAFALAHPELFPMEVNRAPKELLLRVPGLGPLSVKRIVEHRAAARFHDPEALKATGAVVKRATPFLLFAGRHFGGSLPEPGPEQLRLFDESFVYGRPLGDGRRIEPSQGGTYQ